MHTKYCIKTPPPTPNPRSHASALELGRYAPSHQFGPPMKEGLDTPLINMKHTFVCKRLLEVSE